MRLLNQTITKMNEIEKRFFKEETGLDYDPNMEDFYEMECLEARANAKIAIELMIKAWEEGAQAQYISMQCGPEYYASPKNPYKCD